MPNVEFLAFHFDGHLGSVQQGHIAFSGGFGAMRKVFKVICVICFLCVSSAFGCILSKKSTTKFDSNEFIFIGTVIGYTGAVEFDGVRANGSIAPISGTYVNQTAEPKFVTNGVVVRMKDSVHLPIKSEVFEVFEYSLRADCLFQGVSITDLRDEFPLNSEVRVISKKAQLVTVKTSDGHVRLENRLTEDGSIALNSDKNDNRMTTTDSIFDYKTYSYDMNRDSYSRYLLPVFEIRKDLLRLSQTTDQSLRNKILDRIFHAPVAHDIDHGGIFKNYTSSESEYRRYFESHLRATDPDFYIQYKVYQDALDKLVKMGYTKDQAEAALGKALEKGTDIDMAKLYEASLKYLPTRKSK
ncbi:MAG: hypothetical protein HOP17_05250 [Acidobacteria bacterium]|nr:hypothetical protein [Acidobacteriota bacterium]